MFQSELISGIEKHFQEICKEKGINLTAQQEVTVDPVSQLAADLDQFSFDFDPHEYHDQVEDREQAVQDIITAIHNKDVQHLRDWLQPIASDSDDGNSAIAQALLDRLNTLVPVEKAVSREETEALYLVNDSIYLHVQQTDDGWDYTLYDKDSMRQIDGGVLESAAVEESPISRPLAAARTEIMELEGIKPETVVYSDMAILEKLQEAQITIPANYEKQFLESPGDMVAIYQLKPDAPHGLRFERFDSLKEPPDQLHYECTYALSANPDIPRDQLLEQQYPELRGKIPTATFQGAKFFYDDTNWGSSTVYSYVWDAGNTNKQYLGSWPGKMMTKNSEGMWEISFTTTDNLVSPMVIFNNGQGGGTNQTADLSLINYGIYKFNGDNFICGSTWPSNSIVGQGGHKIEITGGNPSVTSLELQQAETTITSA